ARAPNALRVECTTRRGRAILGTVEEFLDPSMGRRHRGKVQLVFTSPPFPLNRKKKDGNLNGEEDSNSRALTLAEAGSGADAVRGPLLA
ncbi:MAG: hypothetical protein AAB113_04215, partial [Candidatus Eisenbacteria bacterium]